MPANIVKSFAMKSGKSEKEIERLWDKAISIAKEDGRKEDDENFYPFVVGILKKMLKMETEESQATITTTSVGNTSVHGGAANYAKKMGSEPKKERKIEKRWMEFIRKYS